MRTEKSHPSIPADVIAWMLRGRFVMSSVAGDCSFSHDSTALSILARHLP